MNLSITASKIDPNARNLGTVTSWVSHSQSASYLPAVIVLPPTTVPPPPSSVSATNNRAPTPYRAARTLSGQRWELRPQSLRLGQGTQQFWQGLRSRE